MNKGTINISWVLLISALVFVISVPILHAGQTDEVESLMEGFETADQPPGSDPPLEDMMSGFEEDPVQTRKASVPDRKQSYLQLDGYLKLAASWNFSHDAPENGETDWRGLSKLKGEAQADLLAKLHPDWRMLISGKVFYDAAYGLRGRDDFTDDVIDNYERESEWREIYLQGRLGKHLDLKLGRQIVVWGRSDNLRITDAINPLDLREPGLTDIEDLRLPLTMSRLDGYFGSWSLTGIAIHEIRFNKTPAFGHDFYPGSTRLPPDEIPSDAGDNTEWGAALNGIFSGKDISFYWADLFDDNARAAIGSSGNLVRKHARVTMWATAGNLALGNWLLKGEAAHWSGLQFFNTGRDNYRRLDGLIGVEYSGWDDTTVTVEWAIRHLIGFDERLKSSPDFAQEDDITNALRLTRTFLNETVEATLLALIYGPLGQDGSLVRLSVDYDWSDAVSVVLGAVLYQSGDRYELQRIGDNDRVFAQIKYSF